MGKGRLPEEAPADTGVQLKPVTLITPPEEVELFFALYKALKSYSIISLRIYVLT